MQNPFLPPDLLRTICQVPLSPVSEDRPMVSFPARTSPSLPLQSGYQPAYGFLRLHHYTIGYIVFEEGFPECQTFFQMKHRDGSFRFNHRPPVSVKLWDGSDRFTK